LRKGAASLFEIQGNREASTLFAERDPIVSGGTGQLRESVGVGETDGDKSLGSSFLRVGG
jgi:hypothetical protein